LPRLSRWGFGLILFADGGNVWENWSKVRLRDFRLHSDPDGPDPTTIYDFRTGVGFGFLYHTPVGPLRLEYGLPQKRARLVSESGQSEIDPQHIWHLSLGFAF
jgi:outer membrane protein assembly factor BamA